MHKGIFQIFERLKFNEFTEENTFGFFWKAIAIVPCKGKIRKGAESNIKIITFPVFKRNGIFGAAYVVVHIV